MKADLMGKVPNTSGRSVLVVVPTLNERDHIEGVLDQLRVSLPDGLIVSFVVADGGSTDGTIKKVQDIAQSDPRVSLMNNPKRLQSAGINLAVARFGAQADVIVRCDAHAAYPAGFIGALMATLDQQETDSVVIPMDSQGGGCLQKAAAWVSNTPLGTGGSAHRAGRSSGYVDHGHHAAFRTKSFQAIGGYDETFSHNEDAEFDCRLRAAGGRVFLDADIRQVYYPRSTLGGMWRQYLNYGRGRSRTVRKHPGSMRLRQLVVPAHLIVSFMSLILSGFVHPIFLLWPVIYLSIIVFSSVFISIKHRSICGILVAPAVFVMHTAWGVGFISGMLLVKQKKYVPEAKICLG